ncbi:hypothetical protein LJR219_002695 [Phenylobacterium sp. LjRoot219]|uniref:hypothetical protein n=1 Tax=Phenylobacterium sp. LjRoot219 TaxID=3342283 RepID=UPI003ECF3CE6
MTHLVAELEWEPTSRSSKFAGAGADDALLGMVDAEAPADLDEGLAQTRPLPAAASLALVIGLGLACWAAIGFAVALLIF